MRKLLPQSSGYPENLPCAGVTGLLLSVGLSALFLFSGIRVPLLAGTVPVDPSMDVSAVSVLLNAARPGDTLLFAPGKYLGPFTLTGVRGDPDNPVVILGAGAAQAGGEILPELEAVTLIDGETGPGEELAHHAFLLRDCAWIVIENFTIRNCWTDLIRAEETSYLTVRGCGMHGGKRALFATGRGSHHFLMEACTWEQEERVWTHADGYTWEELHHGIHGHYNGSLYQGSGTSGVFVLRDNLVRNTFNAFRVSPVNDGVPDLQSCTNGEIYRNTIVNTSDNVLEPEVYTLNLHFYHNRMINGHALISLTGVTGGEICIYGNTAVSLTAAHDGWTVFKISSGERALTRPLYIFNNSWYVDFDIIGSPRNLWRNNHIRHFNNAAFMVQGDTFGIYHLGTDNHFDYDCSNLPFPVLLTGAGHERNGIVADPMFRDPLRGDFRLEAGSPCVDAGTKAGELILDYRGSAPDIGAFDQGRLIQGPPFRFMEPGEQVPYKERPRITRHRIDGDTLMLWFSVPLSGASVSATRFFLEAADASVENERDLDPELTGDGCCLMLSGFREDIPRGKELLPSGWPAGQILLVSRWPEGKNGMPVTSWASAIPVKQSPGAQSGDPGGVLETTRKIADRVIADTEFSDRLVPLEFNANLSQVTIGGYGSGLRGSGNVHYALGKMHSEKEADGLLGLSFRGDIRLFLNGEEIFGGTSPAVQLKEYTYNRFRFHHKIPVRWKQGENELLVRFRQGPEPSQVLLLPLDPMDGQADFVQSVPVTGGEKGGEKGVMWIINGPWHTPGDGMESRLPPERGFAQSYREGEKIMGWRAASRPLVRELVIPEDAAFRRDAYADWQYASGGTLLGILSLYRSTGDEQYLAFVHEYAEYLREHTDYFRWQYFTLHAMRGSYHRLFRMTMLDDSGGPALPLAQLQLMDPGDTALMPILSEVNDYVMHGQQRLPDGTFCRPEPVDSTVWADDLFMSVPFLLRMAEITGDSTLYDEVARQVIRFAHYLEDAATGLWFHGWYDREKTPSPVRWGRANGWVAWAISEALLHMPAGHPAYGRIREIFRRHMEALAGYQDPSGMWHQVLDHPETFEETSCTALFTLAMARGARYGWLPDMYRENALKGWMALQEKIMEDGTVRDICRGTGIGDDVEFYQNRERFDHDPRGLGAMITAGCEIHALLTKNQ